MEIALGAGAEDMRSIGSLYEITCLPAAFEGLKKALEANRFRWRWRKFR